MSWSLVEDLRAQVLRRWQRGELLAAQLTGEELFPLQLKLSKPSVDDITQRFDDVRRWVQLLVETSREQRGYGYHIEWRETRHHVHGRNALPNSIFIPTQADALQFIGKTAEFRRGVELFNLSVQRFPSLRAWLLRKPLCVLDYADEWPRILAVVDYFQQHPRPGCYLRQLDIAQVDSKFIEARKGLIGELLDAVLPAAAVATQFIGARNFEQRYGLKTEAPLIRLRLLDPALFIPPGLSDLSLTAEQFARLVLPVRRVFITENKINGLAFPEVAAALVIFGLGYGLERLAEVEWLHKTQIWYWGDIDTHGFAILDRLRAIFPQVYSFLMDRDTLLAHTALWGQEQAGTRFNGELERLTLPEQVLFEDIKHNRLGKQLRLEQERIGYGWVQRAVVNSE